MDEINEKQQIAQEVNEMIDQITRQFNDLVNKAQPRLPGDVDADQLIAAWGTSESGVRRAMRIVGSKAHRERTGFECLKVYDRDKKHNVIVLRRYIAPAPAP